MKFLFDFFPVLAFYLTFNFSKATLGEINAMISATVVLMIATVLQIAYTWFKHRKIEKMPLVVLVLALIFGGATIYFRDPAYLIWKVTLVNWLFAIAFTVSHFIGEQPIIKHMMSHAISLPENVWRRLSQMWIAFFIILGGINLLVAAHVSFETWVDFKLFGIMGLTLAFAIGQGLYLAKYIQEKPENALNKE